MAINSASKSLQRMRGEHSAGFDLYGNEYLINQSKHDPKPRRSVQYKDGLVGDSSTVPMAWHAWLKGHRDDAPTMDELKQDLINQAEFKAKVKELKIADDKLRMQELTERALNQTMHQSVDMSAQDMLRQLQSEFEQEQKLKRRAPVSKE